jgi:hypothetical protein
MKLFSVVFRTLIIAFTACIAVTSWSPYASAAAGGKAIELDPKSIEFTYQKNLEPFESGECEHQKSPVGLFEWDIRCKIGGEIRKYAVHLVISHYQKTQHGLSAYEVLYWVTDWTSATTPVSDSSTIWFHNDHKENRATVVEVAQGIENDLASLRLLIRL